MRSPLTLAALICATALHAQIQSGGSTQAGRIDVGDARINYVSTGSGPAIVFIHGWSQHLGIWDDQVAAFSPTYRVVRYDLRGFGASSGDADLSADPDDLRILLDSLGIRAAHVVGLSRGAGVALRFAVLFPERVNGLVLYGVGPPAGYQPLPPGPNLMAMFREIAEKHGLDSLGRFLFASPLAWQPPDRPRDTEQSMKQWRQYSGRDLLHPVPESGRTRKVTIDDASGIRLPTLIVHGDHELPLLKAVADTLLRRIPNARKAVIVNGGHGAHFAQPERFNATLHDFFAALPTRK